MGWDSLELLGFHVTSHTIFSWYNHEEQAMYFTKDSEIILNEAKLSYSKFV
jgi:hypothetical protein